ncbi:MAG TPA: universal stress protein [Tepidisphaeraceae bacterium]|jgi:nucleotide-binding universal stress UspA family protein|nr:universal stress protein [Tepidisphaeraceae bacterium]
MIKRILIAVDDSAGAAAAAKVGSELAGDVDGTLALLHVINPGEALVPEVGIDPRILKSQRALASALLSRIRARMETKLKVEQFIIECEPVQGILETAREWDADLLVIGADARGRVASLFLGSVADSVLRRAPCPVITVREQITRPAVGFPLSHVATDA